MPQDAHSGWTPRRVLAGLLDAVPAQRLRHWWPVDAAHHARHDTDPREERMIGAVLVQNTTWTQAERALQHLKEADALSLDGLARLPAQTLERLVRPAGNFQRRARTLQALAHQVADEGGTALLVEQAEDDPDPVRHVLLEVPGIGPETADAILAYALGCRVFVVDAFTRRLMDRLGIHLTGDTERDRDPLRTSYSHIAQWWTRGPAALPRDAETYRITHAAIVEHAKALCHRNRPECPLCPLRAGCTFAARHQQQD